MSNVKIWNVFHNNRSCLDNLHMLQCSLFHSSSYSLGVHFLLLLCAVYFCLEILYESSHCTSFVFVELYIHFSLSHCQYIWWYWYLFCCFAHCFMCDVVIVTWIIIWTILSYNFCYFCWYVFMIEFFCCRDWLAYCVCFCVLFNYITMVLLCGIMTFYFICFVILIVFNEFFVVL